MQQHKGTVYQFAQKIRQWLKKFVQFLCWIQLVLFIVHHANLWLFVASVSIIIETGKYTHNRLTALCPGLPGWVVPTHPGSPWQRGWYQKKHSSTDIHPECQTSFINFLHLLRHSILLVQFTSLAVFSTASLQILFNWSTFWSGTLYFILHTYLHPSVIFFRNTCPYHHNLFFCSRLTEIMLSIPNPPSAHYWQVCLLA